MHCFPSVPDDCKHSQTCLKDKAWPLEILIQEDLELGLKPIVCLFSCFFNTDDFFFAISQVTAFLPLMHWRGILQLKGEGDIYFLV